MVQTTPTLENSIPIVNESLACASLSVEIQLEHNVMS